jgi:mRNA interferase MazF
MDSVYIPKRGDLVWLDFVSQAGHEQSGKRPALVVSPAQYNAKVGLALFMPITSQPKGYPFEVSLPENLPIAGVVLTDQAKRLDWNARKTEYICAIPEKYIREALNKLMVLVK